MYKKKTFIPQTYETLTLQRDKGGKVSVAKRQFGGSPWFARQRVLPDYTDEESQEEKSRKTERANQITLQEGVGGLKLHDAW